MTTKGLSLNEGKIVWYTTCIWTVIVNANEMMWALNVEHVRRLLRNEATILCRTWNFSVHVQQYCCMEGEAGHKRNYMQCAKEETAQVWSCNTHGWRQLHKEMPSEGELWKRETQEDMGRGFENFSWNTDYYKDDDRTEACDTLLYLRRHSHHNGIGNLKPTCHVKA